MVRPGPRVFLQQRCGSHRRRPETRASLRPQFRRLRLGSPRCKHRILAIDNSFHGRTFGAVSVTCHGKISSAFRSSCCPASSLSASTTSTISNPNLTTPSAPSCSKPIQGEGGIYPVSEEFWNRARALATKHGALLIADEIQCGLGRTGRYFALSEIFLEA